MWVEVRLAIKNENKLVTILEGAIEIGSSDGTATFTLKLLLKQTKMINVCYQAP